VTDVALLSNYRTRNLGNLALTRSVQRLLADAYGTDHLLALHRLPHPIADVAAASDVDRWASSLAKTVGPLDGLPPARSTDRGEREPELAPVAKEESTPSLPRRMTVQLAHTTAGTRVRARLDRDAGRAHLGALLGADDVVWNPGGEINTLSTPTTRLVEIEAALSRARRVAMVNLSFEATKETRAFFARRGARLDAVIGRDERTVAELVDLGVPAERARLSPDAVFLLGSDLLPELAPPPRREVRDVVGIVLHGLTPIDAAKWGRVVEHIRAMGSRIEILSSHKAVDGKVIDQLLEAAGDASLTVLPEFTEIGPYLAHLSKLRAVVAARFHTAVMGLVSGTTVVGVDTYGRKVAGGLTTAGFTGAIATGDDWPEQAASIIEAGPTAATADIDATRARVRSVWGEVFPLG
jgi:polysaccharide pyruvyl transferase WcaK-like protein